MALQGQPGVSESSLRSSEHRKDRRMNRKPSMNAIDTAEPRQIAREIRRIILQQSKRAHVGHIGSALSIADIVATLFTSVLTISDPDDPERDRFVLSKGHAALTLYAALHLRGWLPTPIGGHSCSIGNPFADKKKMICASQLTAARRTSSTER